MHGPFRSGLTFAHDELRPALPLPDHVGEQLPGLLKVRRDDADTVAARVPQAGLDRRRLAEIPRELHDRDDVRMPRGVPAHDLERGVAGAVVDEHQIEGVVGKQSLEPKELGHGVVEIRGVLVDGHDDRQRAPHAERLFAPDPTSSSSTRQPQMKYGASGPT